MCGLAEASVGGLEPLLEPALQPESSMSALEIAQSAQRGHCQKGQALHSCIRPVGVLVISKCRVPGCIPCLPVPEGGPLRCELESGLG